MNVKNLLLLVSAVAAAFVYVGQQDHVDPASRVGQPHIEEQALPTNEQDGRQASALEQAIEQRARNVTVEGAGTVVKMLRDDVNGSRHQKFLLRLPSGQVLLMVHNIDLAPRVDGLREGERVEFSGEYIWNEKGGLVHWTHHDPQHEHASGWLKHMGRTYQ